MESPRAAALTQPPAVRAGNSGFGRSAGCRFVRAIGGGTFRGGDAPAWRSSRACASWASRFGTTRGRSSAASTSRRRAFCWPAPASGPRDLVTVEGSRRSPRCGTRGPGGRLVSEAVVRRPGTWASAYRTARGAARISREFAGVYYFQRYVGRKRHASDFAFWSAAERSRR